MPAAWPMGQTLLPNVLGGDTRQQIHSVWEFLADGDKAAMPLGLGRDPIELIADAEPVIYRNFVEGAGPRAIGVGYPQKINLAFDANDLRLALLWQGSFMDAAKHWTDRGAGFQAPLGDNVLKLPAGVEFATLENEAAAWPTQSARQLGGQFRGYRLNAQREPIFLYDVGTVRVEDHPRPIGPSESGRVVRSLTLTRRDGPTARLWFRAAAGAKIEPAEGGAFRVDGQWQVKVTTPGGAPCRANERQSSGTSRAPVRGIDAGHLDPGDSLVGCASRHPRWAATIRFPLLRGIPPSTHESSICTPDFPVRSPCSSRSYCSRRPFGRRAQSHRPRRRKTIIIGSSPCRFPTESCWKPAPWNCSPEANWRPPRGAARSG